MMKRHCPGFSLVETLVVLAIISILMALCLPSLVKARRKAEEVAIKESFRQDYIGDLADNVNAVSQKVTGPNRDECRAAFRHKVTDQRELWITEMKYVVGSEQEFRAYWYTLIDPKVTAPLKFDASGSLIAQDENKNEYHLTPLSVWSNPEGGSVPIQWEFISTDLSETSSGTLGTSVLYSDGHTLYLRYPGGYPACSTVAELSHQFVKGG